jgi:hypothetical protein
MTRSNILLALCGSAALALVFTTPPAAHAEEINPELAALVTRYYQPNEEEAQQIAGMSRQAHEALALRTERFLEELATIDRSSLSISDRIDYDYFSAQLDNCLQSLRDTRFWQKRPGDYVPFNGYFAATLDEAIPWEERYPVMIEALTAELDNFDHAKENLEGPPPLWIERAVTLVENTLRYLDTDMVDIIARAPNPALAQEMEEAAQTYRLALEDYRVFLTEELVPGEIADLAVGEKEYLRLLRNFFLDYSVEEMVAIGTELYEETELLMEQTAAAIDPDKTWRQLIEENRLDHRAPWELFDDLTREAERAKKIVYDELINVPPDVIEEYRYVHTAHPMTIPRGASGIGPFGYTHGNSYVGYYSLPSIDQYDTPQRQSEFMMDWSRAWYIAQQIPHEVYPGHHFAIFMYDKSPRPARRLVGSAPYTDVSSSMSEGWAVYVEEVMYDLGYLNDEPRLFLGHLQHRLWRIARIILDPQFHTGRIDYDYMVDFFEGTGTSRGQAHVEATQITNIPAHDVGYYMGVVEIKALLDEYRAIVGEELFDFKDFHTTLMLAGNVPVALLRPEILEHARELAAQD